MAKLAHSKLLSLEHFAVRTIAKALEVDHKSGDDLLNTMVISAAQWLLQAGPEIYERDVENTGAMVYIDSGKKNDITGPLLRQARQTSPIGQWNFWKERFAVMRDRDDLDNSARDLAGQALDSMLAVERERT